MFRNAIAMPAGAALLFAFAGACAAQDVYQWKDAQGVTHYSEAPPASGKYQQRDTRRDRAPVTADASATVATTPAKPADKTAAGSAPCVATRQNLSLLESKAPVQQDIDGDGKADKTLNDTERANQLELARAQLKAQNCGG